MWTLTVGVSSAAKRVRQRALGAHALSDEIGPGESFDVVDPFVLPAGAEPAGVVISHGAFPGILLIGDDQSFLHRRTLLRVTARPR